MSLTLKFHGNSPDQKGYIIIDGHKMILGFLSEQNLPESQAQSKEKRDVFARYLSEFVCHDLNDPSIKSCIVKEDHSPNIGLKNQYDINAYNDYIFLTFKEEINFKSLWILLTHIPSSKLNHLIHPSCVTSMLKVAMEYFIEIFDENAVVKQEQSEDKALSLSNSPTIFGLHFFASANKKDNEVSKSAVQKPSRSSKVFFFDETNVIIKGHVEARKAATSFTNAAMFKDEEFRREFYSNV